MRRTLLLAAVALASGCAAPVVSPTPATTPATTPTTADQPRVPDASGARRCVHAFVTGVVQGVGFRAGTRDEASRLGLVGWVRNLSDGRVELVAEGSAGDVDALLVWARRGPPAARVDAVNALNTACTGARTSFEVDPTL